MGKSRNRNKDKESSGNVVARRGGGRMDEYFSDSDESVSTHLTFDDDMRSVRGDTDMDLDESHLAFLDSLSEHIENASHKNISIRMAALKHLQLALTARYLDEFLLKWKSTLCDLISKNLRRTDEEATVAGSLLALLALQIGDELSEGVEECVSECASVLLDPARSEKLRAHLSLCQALAVYIASESDETLAKSIKLLHDLWMGVRKDSANTALFTQAVAGWSLLLQNADGSTLLGALSQSLPRLMGYLESPQLANRTAAGEAIAHLYELADEAGAPEFSQHNVLVEVLSGLAHDSSKQRAKKEKRTQKLTFRQILSCVADGDAPSIAIRFHQQHSLQLDTCQRKLVYDTCTEILHGGMLRQLQDNRLLRQLFDLGAPLSADAHKQDKAEKHVRMQMLDAQAKYREQHRSKQRDKRAC